MHRGPEQHADLWQAALRSRLPRYWPGCELEFYLGIANRQETGPHLFEFSPAGTAFEYYAHSIGARSQSAKTYLEQNYEAFEDASLEELVRHGLNALADTLQQDKNLTMRNTSIGIIGPSTEAVDPATGGKVSGAAQRGYFRVIENDDVEPILRSWRRSRGEPEDEPEAEGEAEQQQDGAEGAGNAAAAPADDVEMAS